MADGDALESRVPDKKKKQIEYSKAVNKLLTNLLIRERSEDDKWLFLIDPDFTFDGQKYRIEQAFLKSEITIYQVEDTGKLTHFAANAGTLFTLWEKEKKYSFYELGADLVNRDKTWIDNLIPAKGDFQRVIDLNSKLSLEEKQETLHLTPNQTVIFYRNHPQWGK